MIRLAVVVGEKVNIDGLSSSEIWHGSTERILAGCTRETNCYSISMLFASIGMVSFYGKVLSSFTTLHWRKNIKWACLKFGPQKNVQSVYHLFHHPKWLPKMISFDPVDLPSGKRLHSELENHHFQCVNPPFLWPFSIFILNYQRVCHWYPHVIFDWKAQLCAYDAAECGQLNCLPWQFPQSRGRCQTSWA